MSGKKPIGEFGKTFDYLQNPELRQKENGDALITINNALFGSAEFRALTWRNIRFVDCDFASSYAIKLKGSEDLQFEGCRFAGVLGFGKMTRVQFAKCAGVGKLNMIGDAGSTNVRFEDCKFQGDDADQNHFGALGTEGETEFTRCQFKYMSIYGDTKLTIRDCEFEDVDCPIDGATGGSEVLIENSKLRGKFDMRPSTLLSLTIRKTIINSIDMSDATIKGDVVLESLDAGYINAGVRSVRNFTIRKSTVRGLNDKVFIVGADSTGQFLAEDVIFGRGNVGIGAGRPLTENEWSAAPANKIIAFRNCTLPMLDASWLESQHFLLEKCELQQADISNCRIGKLEIKNTHISEKIDLSNTRVHEQDLTGMLADKGRKEKLDGTNVKLPG